MGALDIVAEQWVHWGALGVHRGVSMVHRGASRVHCHWGEYMGGGSGWIWGVVGASKVHKGASRVYGYCNVLK